MREWNEFSQTLDAIEDIERQAIRETARIVSDLIKRREELGMTQAELATKAGLKQSAIARLERASTIPRMDTIQKVAHALGLQFTLIPEQEAATALLAYA